MSISKVAQFVALCILICAAAEAGVTASVNGVILLPNAWILQPPSQLATRTGTLPQGAAASPDGATIAVVESGYNPPKLRLYSATDLKDLAAVALPDAYGRPLWVDGTHVLVAGANAGALFEVDVRTRDVRKIAFPKGVYPIQVAMAGTTLAVATEGDQSVRVGTLDAIASAKPIHAGEAGGLAFSPDGKWLFASDCAGSSIEAIDTQTAAVRPIATGPRPTALLPVDDTIYVAESGSDMVGIYDDASGARLDSIYVGDPSTNGVQLTGVSPNALARAGDAIYVSLGAANALAVIRDRHVVARWPAGWYPTDVVPVGQKLYVINGKGEGTRPNPRYVAGSRSDVDYVAAIQWGSIRTVDLSQASPSPNPQGATSWTNAQTSAVVRKDGPIRHVFFILKENRSYDQVLGDAPEGNGDSKLTTFGARVTPNEHALAARFGLFDNTYVSGEVSEPGHSWADAAFVTDFVERMWPITYAGRRKIDDSVSKAAIPPKGYMWQAARAAGVSFRDYGEMVDPPDPTLAGLYDPHYVGWNLNYSDLDRVREWRREFTAFLRNGTLPQLEYIWLPNDHTYGNRPGKLTPVSYVAQNDYALGRIVDTISHSSVWHSSAIFVIEDDAQDGPDHVSDQRTTFFLISPYARGGVQHAHYSTTSVLRTMELMLGLAPLSTYDGMAVSLHAAFSNVARLAPYDAIPPKVSLTTRTQRAAYVPRATAHLDFSRPDANPPALGAQ